MPISNPIVNLIINPPAPPPLPVVLVENTDPLVAPERDRVFWLNTLSSSLWVAIGTQSISDWRPVGGSSGDIATILGAIVVENNAVVTDGNNVIYEL